MKKIALASVVVLLLAGCATSADDAESSLAPAPTQTTEATATTTSEPEVVVEPLTPERVREIVFASYEKFEAEGMTETVISDGETIKLINDPTQPDYMAAWFNLTTGERELIFETDYFSIFIAYLQLEQDDLVITELEGGFRLEDSLYGSSDYFYEDGLIVRGAFAEVTQTFEYSVDPELRKGLEELAEELISSF
jgi:hypothetical protein